MDSKEIIVKLIAAVMAGEYATPVEKISANAILVSNGTANNNNAFSTVNVETQNNNALDPTNVPV